LRALLPAAAILIPASLLALLGVRAYSAEALLLREKFKKDQVAVVQLVGRRLSEEGRRAIADLSERVRDHDPDEELEGRFLAAQPLARHIFLVRGGELIYPEPSARRERGSPLVIHGIRPAIVGSRLLVTDLDVQRYIKRARRERRRGQLLGRGLQAEHQGHPALASRIFLRVAKGQGEAAARALTGLARLERARHADGEAQEFYGRLRARFSGWRDALGVDYGLLADAGLAELRGENEILLVHKKLMARGYRTSDASRRFYLRWLVRRLEGIAGADAKRFERVRQRTERLFASERFGRRVERLGVSELVGLADAGVSGVALDRHTGVVLQRRGSVLVGFSVDGAELERRVERQSSAHLPSAQGLHLAVYRAGESVPPQPFPLIYQGALATPLTHWTLRAWSSGHRFEATERAGRLGQLGMVTGLIVLLISGLLFTYRGVRRETDLAQLKSDFVSTVSHELKTPLTSIRMYAEMLREGIAATPEARDRYEEVIIRESERLGQLITNVLDFSRIERGTRRYEIVSEDLWMLVGEAVETFQRLSDGDQVEIKCVGDTHPAWALVDREAMMVSVLNLLSNAAKYSLGAKKIEVRVARGRWGWGISIKDEGMGIDPAEQRRIFEDFYRSPLARRAGVEGTGLGLSLVRRHVVACGGRVEVESEMGVGSTFTIWVRETSEETEESCGEDSDHRG